ncbi:MAG: NUDIX hydrolase [Candidatus Doudnabacteria bacterium]|nr:NUDIX hydrolase [Candidatus Doudnabacteria bacterium]
MLFLDAPRDFDPKFSIALCVCQYDGKILMLRRSEKKPSEGGKWGFPAGKINGEETEVRALIREVREETGIILDPTQIIFVKTVYVRYPAFDFVSHLFFYEFFQETEIVLNRQEHSEYAWIEPAVALNMDLILHEPETMKIYGDHKFINL